MILCGIDIYFWNSHLPELPTEHGKFRLKLIANQGTKIYPPPAPEITLSNWHQCRFLSQETISNEDVDALISYLSAQGFNWTKCQKLFKTENVNLFSEPY